ncbi:MAG: GNAT family N-acetyltransferase [Chloroflexota bacterium]|nr:GNAT family N-acetyltransferase [Chloroflexota bacterium]
MAIRIISVDKSNVFEWRSSVRTVFGDIPSEDTVIRMVNDRFMIDYDNWKEPSDRLIAAFDTDSKQIVGSGGADKYTITVPGGENIKMAGIAYMGTLPTHKRRGIFSSMMKTLHQQARDRGDAVAGLWASQSLLYNRFGYGLATMREDWIIETHDTSLSTDSPKGISVRLVDKNKALNEIPEIYETFRKCQNGATDRTQGYWNYLLYEDEQTKFNKSGLSGFFFAIVYKNNKPSGYAIYNFNKESGVAHEDDKGSLIVEEIISTDRESNNALWHYIFGVELVEEISFNRRGTNDPLYYMLKNPRKLKRNIIDGLWARIIDPIKMLESRTYQESGKITINISGQNQDDIEGKYTIETDGKNTEVKKTNNNPDISMRPSELSSIYFGSARASEFYQAGLFDVKNNDILRNINRMFSVEQSPWCNTDF